MFKTFIILQSNQKGKEKKFQKPERAAGILYERRMYLIGLTILTPIENRFGGLEVKMQAAEMLLKEKHFNSKSFTTLDLNMKLANFREAVGLSNMLA